MIKNSRFERKYQITNTEYFCILNAIRPFVVEDPIAKKKGGRYFVRSLYFDSAGYDCYAEKVSGVSDRTKLRIRSYAKELENTDVISFEIKTKKADQIIKYSSHISPEEFIEYVSAKKLPDRDDSVLEEFKRLKNLYHLKPVVVVDYDREAYFSKEEKSVRITFDHNVRTAYSDQLFKDEKNLFFKYSFQTAVVLEIKSQMRYPKWLSELCKRYGLSQLPNSKFAQGIENSSRDVLR